MTYLKYELTRLLQKDLIKLIDDGSLQYLPKKGDKMLLKNTDNLFDPIIITKVIISDSTEIYYLKDDVEFNISSEKLGSDLIYL